MDNWLPHFGGGKNDACQGIPDGRQGWAKRSVPTRVSCQSAWADEACPSACYKSMKTITTVEELSDYLGRGLLSYLPPFSITHPGIRLVRAADNIVAAIKNGDADSIDIACLLIVKDPNLPFGKLIKSNMARAMRRHVDKMSASQRSAIVRKTAELLRMEFCPREAEDYCKLVRKFGVEAIKTIGQIHPSNEKAKQLVINITNA
jgi:hypothetical protein